MPTKTGAPTAPASTNSTCSEPTHERDVIATRDYEAGFCAGWVDRAEYARRTSLTFDDGVEFGYAMASRAINNAIAEAAAPLPADATEIVHRLVHNWDSP